MRSVWPFRHIGLKLLSAALAVSLWYAVSGEETVERGLRVPLELQQFPQGLELQGDPPAAVDVRVRGSSGTLGRVGAGDIVAVLDLRGVSTGRRLFHLTPEQVRAPFGVDVVQVSPTTIALTFERTATGRVRVVPAIDGRPAPGYVIGTITTNPATVEVAGPENSVKRVTEALTEPVVVTGAREPIRDVVSIGFLDPELRLKGPRTATVSVQVLPGPEERTIQSRPVHLRNLSPKLSARAVPAVVAVGVRGSREALNRLDPDDVDAYVDLAGLGSGEYTLTVHANATPDAGVTHIAPATVQVRIASGNQ
ncbi:MAG: YbbR-like domain-containing protein [Betaproteobacteria bacterium]